MTSWVTGLSRHAPLPSGQAGFSLLEMIVAMAIMAFSLGALYNAAGGSVKGVQAAEQRAGALFLAQSLLDAHGTVPAGGLTEQGTVDGMRWQLSAVPYPTGREASPGWPLYRVEVRVEWAGGRQGVSLVSLLPERGLSVTEATQ
ncbi:type IV pilus modification PilV family protein [Parazoarcus communis]|uniref:General secretion pathway protein GspI n=1 Tax=Parazoarcus communis SWub3 = DSM 12120 TaxID=1121029 RepID=A0A323UWB5_9RHOO|nr:type II secretion system protein [Parazoarcus communis]NMG70951.1 prepilin-type N-terminal cleavage/methylation domain-containing protein [Parazoarcus communis SWub3 = DSM 12120]PZA16263.1 general secretion pathway protein GspI [Azoarcus communis] [Parazoarcus communis SWub3 = DSM 12120]